MGSSSDLRISLKNPTKLRETFEIGIDRNSTLGELRRKITLEYPGNPHPDDVTLVFAGKILPREDSVQLSTIFPETDSLFAVHMVIKTESRIKTKENAPESSGTSERKVANSSLRVCVGSARQNNAHSKRDDGRLVRSHDNHLSQSVGSDKGLAGVAPEGMSARGSHAQDEVCSTEIPGHARTPGQNNGNSFGATQHPMYEQVFQAAYRAAIGAIVMDGTRHACGTRVQPGQGQYLHGWANSLPSTHAVAILPTVLSVPQPILPRSVTQNPSSESQPASHNNAQNSYLMPVLPVAYQVPTGEDTIPTLRMRRNRSDTEHERRDDNRQEQAVGLTRMLQALREQERNAPQENRRNPDAVRANARERQIRIRIQLNLRVILQMLVLFVIVYQHCPPGRLLALSLLGLILYVSSTTFGRSLLNGIMNYFNNPRHPRAPQNNEREGNGAEGDHPPINNVQDGAPIANRPIGERPEEQGGILREIQAFLAGFFTSLLPAADHRQDAIPDPAAQLL